MMSSENPESDVYVDNDEIALLESNDTNDGIDDAEAQALLSAATKRANRAALNKSLGEANAARLNRLNELRRAQSADNTSAEKRLEYLMSQADVYTHFVHGNSGGSKSKSLGNGPAGKRGHTLSEKDEDQTLLKENDEGLAESRLVSQPTILQGKLREYQLEGLNWMVNLHANSISGILADEMGLGKTLQSISLLAYLKETGKSLAPHLVLAPKSVIGNWAREFQKFCPSLRVLLISPNNKEERIDLLRQMVNEDYEVIIASYETFTNSLSVFRRIDWYYLIIDEAHRVKNEKSKLANSARSLNTQFRLLLTGTPLQNNLHELWSLLNFLLPDIFSSSEDFDAWFATGDSTEVVRKLHSVIRPFLLRRLKVDVERSLPPKTEIKVLVGMSELQRKWYKSLLSKDASALTQMGGPERSRLMNTLMQLRKCCNHPYLFDGAEPGPPFIDGPHLWENSGKMALLHKLLPKLRSQGSRVLIFSQMTRMLDILDDYLRLNGMIPCRIDGNTSSQDRQQQMDDFNAEGSDKFVFLLATRAGGLGINLYTADVVILYDSDWNPQADLQAQDRAHRIGQKKEVKVYRLVTDSSVEEKIVERAERKLYLDAAVIQQGRLAQVDKGLGKDELLQMVKFGADDIIHKGEGSTITDEDIDRILERSQQKTRETSKRLQEEMHKQLGGLSIDELLKYDTGRFTQEESNPDFSELLALSGEREKRKAIYNEQQRLSAEPVRVRASGPKQIKIPTMYDFQFFQKAAIEQFFRRESELATQRRDAERTLKEVLAQEAKEQSQFVKQRVQQLCLPVSEGGLEMSVAAATDAAKAEWAQQPLRSAAIEAEMETLQLSPEEAAEKERLLEEGFSSWSRNDYRAFLSACERHGRTNREAIFTEVAEATEKDYAEVQRYYETFWMRLKEITDWKRVEERIEKGEQKLKRRETTELLVAEKVAKSPDPFRSLVIPYGPNKPATRGFSEDEDRFLICMMNVLGFGAWSALRAEIRRAEQFRFDWFIQSRSASDLSKRCEALVKMLEKEATDEGTAAGKEILAAEQARAAAKLRRKAEENTNVKKRRRKNKDVDVSESINNNNEVIDIVDDTEKKDEDAEKKEEVETVAEPEATDIVPPVVVPDVILS